MGIPFFYSSIEERSCGVFYLEHKCDLTGSGPSEPDAAGQPPACGQSPPLCQDPSGALLHC